MYCREDSFCIVKANKRDKARSLDYVREEELVRIIGRNARFDDEAGPTARCCRLQKGFREQRIRI